jgi:hypothetical protein
MRLIEAQYGVSTDKILGFTQLVEPSGAGAGPARTLSSGRDTGLGILILLLLGGIYHLTTLPWQWLVGGAAVIVLGVAALVVLVRGIRRKTLLRRGKIVGDPPRKDFVAPAVAGPLEDMAGPLKDVASALEDVAVVLRKDFADAAIQRQEYQKAVQLLRPLAEKGHASSQYNLGVLYDQGLGVEQDCAEAVKWFRRAAEQDVASAKFNLGVLYENGQGVPRNLVQAYMWFELSAAHGEQRATQAREMIAQDMTGAQIAEALGLASEWKPRHG